MGVLAVLCLCLGGCQTAALRSAKIYIQQDNWEAAKEQLEDAVATTPGDAEAHYLLGLAYGREGAFAEMNASFGRSLEISSLRRGEIESWRQKYWLDQFERGSQAIQAEDFSAASAAFAEAIAVDPDRIEAHKNLAFSYYRQDRPAESIAAYQRALNLDPGDSGTMARIGFVQYNSGNLEEATEYLLQAVELDPENVTALSTLGAAQADLNRAEAALETYGRALELRPEDGHLLANMARLHWQRDDHEQAARYYGRALALAPQDVRIKRDLAMAQLKLGKLQESLDLLVDVTAQTPNDRDAWFWLGHVYANLNRIDESEEAFAQAAALDARQ